MISFLNDSERKNKPKFPIAQLDAKVSKPSAFLEYLARAKHSHGWP